MLGRVLVVEDNKHLRAILASLVQLLGYEVLVAATGKEAIEKAASEKPGLILMDLDLPDIAGQDVARKIREDPVLRKIPILGCSAFSVGDERQRALDAGMLEYLQKPIPTEQLRRSIERHILMS